MPTNRVVTEVEAALDYLRVALNEVAATCDPVALDGVRRWCDKELDSARHSVQQQLEQYLSVLTSNLEVSDVSIGRIH